MSILVTGGAGYVGSHAVRELQRSDATCVVLDNLSRGHRELVRDAELVVGDIADEELVLRVISDHSISAVMHFAAFAYVGESVQDPGAYYQNNVAGTIALLRAMQRAGVKMLVFSSTCATYGVPDAIPITENHPQRPVNPYGASKLMVERILKDFELADGIRSIVFRYFNAAGADASGDIGEWHEPETHLIPIAIEAAMGRRRGIEIYGTDYPTRDGTCVRDYIHVSDLARAHVLGLKHIESGLPSETFNLGNGDGFTVREVINVVERVTGSKITAFHSARRPGDPHALVSSSARAQQVLGWIPKFKRLEEIVETAWSWHRRRPGVASRIAARVNARLAKASPPTW